MSYLTIASYVLGFLLFILVSREIYVWIQTDPKKEGE